MTKLSEIFEVLYESDLMPVTDGEIIILPNVSLSKIVDLTSKLGALDSGLEPMGYNRYQLILPDEIDMEVADEEIPEEPVEAEVEEVKDSEEDKSEEESESEENDDKESEDDSKKDSEKDEKMDKAVDEICDILSDWIKAEPVNEAYTADESNEKIIQAVASSCNTSEEDAWDEILAARQNYAENVAADPERSHEYLEWALQDLGIEPDYTMDFLDVPHDEVEAEDEDEDDYDVASELEKMFSNVGDEEIKDLKKNEVATYLESFANPNEIYEAQEDEYEKEEAPKAEAKPAAKKGISTYLTSEAEDVIDITEPAEKQALIDLLVHNKEVLWGPTSSKIQAFRSELENLDDADLEAKADEVFPEWKKHIKKYIVEPKPAADMPKEDEGPAEDVEEVIEEPVEEEVPEEVPEAAEDYQEEIKPEEQILTEEPAEESESEEHPEDCECEECLAKRAAESEESEEEPVDEAAEEPVAEAIEEVESEAEEELEEVHMAPGFSAMEDLFEPNWTTKSKEKAKETGEKVANKVIEKSTPAKEEQAD